MIIGKLKNLPSHVPDVAVIKTAITRSMSCSLQKDRPFCPVIKEHVILEAKGMQAN